ncbi:MAG: hypothetical protein IKG97_07245 [Lachnospiraceae bacterium]|nr:hypothetical protein [Lachnospiraceae bacterium]
MPTAEQLRIKQEMLGNGITDHNGLSWLCSYMSTQGKAEPRIRPEEKEILRKYARLVAFYADEPVQEERKTLWFRNRSLKETRPLIFIDPEYAWYEIIPHTMLECTSNLARIWEMRLRKEIYWQEHIRDDRVCTKDFPVCHVYSISGMGISQHTTKSAQSDGAYAIDSVLTDWDDLGKLRFRELSVDFDKTALYLALAHDVFDGILNVEINDSWWYSDSLTDTLLYFRGFQNMMTDLIDYPDEVHALMEFLRDDQLHMLDQLEQAHLLTLNNKGEFIGTGGYGWCRELPGADYDPSAVTCKDLWGYCESQASVSVSPRMFDEYFLDYQVPILDRFGLSFYGCCEDLDKRLKYLRNKVKNLRIVAVSPWSNAESMASQIRGDYVYCWKQNPALIAVEKPDWDAVRKELREVFRITAEYGCRVNVLMRDVRTLAFRPENASTWAKIAMEEASLYQARRIHA